MLPFTKRPGRGEEAGDVSKDDLARTGASASLPRKPMVSVSDEEMTTLMPTKALGNTGMVPAAPPSRPATVPPPRSVRPAAGMPPPSRSAPPPSMSSRSFAHDDEEEDGRTVVRGAPKIVKRAPTKAGLGQPTMPTTISPAAVIKATLDSARAARGESLMAGPPAELLEDRGEVHPADEGPQRTAILAQSGGNPAHSQPPPSLQSGPHGALQSGGHAAFPVASGYPSSMGPQAMNQTFGPPMSVRPQPPSNYPPAYGQPVPSASVSVPGLASSVPAHFMVPSAPYSDARTDPPATSVTSRTRASGRPATSWAMALLACGLFVGVGAVAAIQRNGPLMDTTASFVDPSHAAAQRAAAAAVPMPAPVPVPVPVEAPKVAPAVTAPTAAQPVALVATTIVPVTPAATTAVAAAAPPPAAHPTGAVIGASPVPPPPVATQAPAPVAATPAPPKAESRPPAAAKVAAAPPPPAAAARPAPERKVASSDEEPKKPASKKGASAKGDSTDEETKKALEALQKAQLESSQSFGEK